MTPTERSPTFVTVAGGAADKDTMKSPVTNRPQLATMVTRRLVMTCLSEVWEMIQTLQHYTLRQESQAAYSPIASPRRRVGLCEMWMVAHGLKGFSRFSGDSSGRRSFPSASPRSRAAFTAQALASSACQGCSEQPSRCPRAGLWPSTPRPYPERQSGHRSPTLLCHA